LGRINAVTPALRAMDVEANDMHETPVTSNSQQETAS
jgi:hypothetical protein